MRLNSEAKRMRSLTAFEMTGRRKNDRVWEDDGIWEGDGVRKDDEVWKDLSVIFLK